MSIAIGLSSLLASAAFAIWIMLQGTGGKFEWSWFYPWVLSPYFAFGFLCIASASRTAAYRRSALVTAVIVSIVSIYTYVNATLDCESSTAALIFVFMPLYLLIGGLAVFGISTLIGRLLRARSDT